MWTRYRTEQWMEGFPCWWAAIKAVDDVCEAFGDWCSRSHSIRLAFPVPGGVEGRAGDTRYQTELREGGDPSIADGGIACRTVQIPDP